MHSEAGPKSRFTLPIYPPHFLLDFQDEATHLRPFCEALWGAEASIRPPGPVAGLSMSVALASVNTSTPHTSEASHRQYVQEPVGVHTPHLRKANTTLSDCMDPTSTVCKGHCEDTLRREVRWCTATPSNHVVFVRGRHLLKLFKLHLGNCRFPVFWPLFHSHVENII